MAVIEIEWLKDSVECDRCGWNLADGAAVRIDGREAFQLTPVAACFDGEDYDRDDVFRRILEHFGRWTSIVGEEELLAEITKLGHTVHEIPASPES
jgi:hypothetical protein